jgi:hypothetical protein
MCLISIVGFGANAGRVYVRRGNKLVRRDARLLRIIGLEFVTLSRRDRWIAFIVVTCEMRLNHSFCPAFALS